MLLAGNVDRVDDLVHLVGKADVRLDRLAQRHGCDQVMGLDDLLIVVSQANACQTEEGLIAGMLGPM